jgi:hypothetical protein
MSKKFVQNQKHILHRATTPPELYILSIELFLCIAQGGWWPGAKCFFDFGQIFLTCEKNPQFSNFSKYQGGKI